MRLATGDLLAPYVPTKEDPFDLKKAAHLLRRTAFAGSLAERRRLVRMGPEKAVASVFAPGQGAVVDDVLEDILAMGGLEQVRGYRVWRMLTGKHRLRERMSLFWHDHFATSNQKVKNVGMMARQLAMFDRLGLGKFDDLLLAVSRDPAMIRWLDSDTNARGNPNENYAREMFELFALGEGNYTEKDVRQAARAFTGWHLRDEKFTFRLIYHDIHEKEVFGKKGKFTGQDIVSMTVAHPAAAPFLARKWLSFFVHPIPTDGEVAAVAKVYVANDRHIESTLKVLLRSRLFFSQRAHRSMIKSPADYVVGMVRSIGARAASLPLARAMTKMGQALLEPPNVAGWKGGRAWVTSASWLIRSNFAGALFDGRFKVKPSAAELLPGKSGRQRADTAILLLLDGDVSEKTRATVRALAAKNTSPASLLQAVQCLPEGQML